MLKLMMDYGFATLVIYMICALQMDLIEIVMDPVRIKIVCIDRILFQNG
jgi:hypothetical protein